MAMGFIGQPMQGGVCVGVRDMDKPIADNKSADHLMRHQPTRKQTRTENVCETVPRSVSVDPFPPLPPVPKEKVKRGWTRMHGAAVMHGVTRYVDSPRVRMQRMVKMYLPPVPDFFPCRERYQSSKRDGIEFLHDQEQLPRIEREVVVMQKKVDDISYYRRLYAETRRLTIFRLIYLQELIKLEFPASWWDMGKSYYD